MPMRDTDARHAVAVLRAARSARSSSARRRSRGPATTACSVVIGIVIRLDALDAVVARAHAEDRRADLDRALGRDVHRDVRERDAHLGRAGGSSGFGTQRAADLRVGLVHGADLSASSSTGTPGRSRAPSSPARASSRSGAGPSRVLLGWRAGTRSSRARSGPRAARASRRRSRRTRAALPPSIAAISALGQAAERLEHLLARHAASVPSGCGKSVPHMMFARPISWRSSASRRGMHDAPRNTLRAKYSRRLHREVAAVVAELLRVVASRRSGSRAARRYSGTQTVVPSVIATLSFGKRSKTPPQIRNVSGRTFHHTTSET